MVRRVLEALLHPTTAAAVLLGALAAAGIESALFAASLTQHHLYAWIWLVVIAAPAATLGLASSLLTLAGDERGKNLALPFTIGVIVTAVWVVANLPPVGRAFAEYKINAVENGLRPPSVERREYYPTPMAFAEDHAEEIRDNNSAVAVIGAALYLYALRRRPRRSNLVVKAARLSTRVRSKALPLRHHE